MRGFVAVFTREIFERRLLGAVALALGGVATILPLIPGLLPGGLSVSELQGALASGCALLLTAILALSLGASIIASDLVERRLGFYFARPLAGWAVWAGKLGAALALLLGAGLLVVTPALLAGGSFNLNGVWSVGEYSATGSGLLFVWIVALLPLLLASHAVSVIIRARSVWALLDIGALALVAGLVWGASRRLQMEGVVRRLTYWSGREGDLGILAWMEIGFFCALLLALAVAGAFQVIEGRTDVRRSHRVLSQTLWGALLAAAVLFMGVAVWTLAAGPDDLVGISQVSVSPNGRWIAFSGPAARRPGYDPSFLYDVDTGRSIRARFGLIALYGYAPPVHFSEDGRWAVWLQWDVPPHYPVVLYRLDLSRPGANPERTSISFSSLPTRWVLSPDGRRIAFFLGDHRLTVEEIGGPLLAAVRFDGAGAFPLLAFAGPDRLRILDGPFVYGALRNFPPSEGLSAVPNLFELDLTSRPLRIVPTGVMPRGGMIREVSLSPDASHALQLSRQTLRLFDARSGELLADLGDGRVRGVFLNDGRIALATRVAGGQELRLLAADGRSELWRLPFPGAHTLIVADQRGAPGTLRVVTSGSKPTRELWVVDLSHGTARSLGRRRFAYPVSPLVALHLPSHPVTLTDKDGMIWLDPSILRERLVLKGS
jgi:hypothetical protein